MSERRWHGTDLQAAEWVVRLEDRERPISAQEQSEFFNWLMRSAEHVKAFLTIADLSRALDGIDSERRLDIEKLFPANRVAALPAHPGAAARLYPSGRPSTSTRIRIGLLAACATLVLAAYGGWKLWAPLTSYRTAVGEQRTLRLPDGSVLNLNTRSRVVIRFSKNAREVQLLEGEALFAVERDPSRPFSVVTQSAVIRVVGTQFNVYDRPDATTVSVVEGAVQVAPAAHPTAANLLSAGEEVQIAPSAAIKRKHVDLHNALAWRERRLVFENASLGEVIAEFNRYNTVQMRADEALAADKHLTAIFSADQPQSLIHYLEQDPALAVEQAGHQVDIRQK